MRQARTVTIDNCGWKKSRELRQSVVDDGEPCPWIVYSCLYFLEDRINDSMSIFEYGAGNSTLWFKKRAKSVVSVESDEEWVNYLKEQNKDLDVHYRPLDMSYVNFIEECGMKFDVIVVDGAGALFNGKGRKLCSEAAIHYLTDNGIIILDNSDARPEAGTYLVSQGFKRLDFFGLAPINIVFHGTTIFYKADNVLGI